MYTVDHTWYFFFSFLPHLVLKQQNGLLNHYRLIASYLQHSLWYVKQIIQFKILDGKLFLWNENVPVRKYLPWNGETLDAKGTLDTISFHINSHLYCTVYFWIRSTDDKSGSITVSISAPKGFDMKNKMVPKITRASKVLPLNGTVFVNQQLACRMI